jgi:hypothetical protein
MNMTTAARTRKTKQQPRSASLMVLADGSKVLWLTIGGDAQSYGLTPLDSDFGTAFRLAKADRGDGRSEQYDVCLLEGGRSTCECKGHLAHAHKGTVCKHIASLFQLQKQGKL